MQIMSTWRWRLSYLAFSVCDGVAIAIASKQSVPLIAGLCMALCVIRLALEAVRPS